MFSSYLSAFITFIALVIIVSFVTYVGGVYWGIAGCIVIAYYNLAFSQAVLPNKRLKRKVNIFFLNFIIALPVMLSMNQIFLYIKNGEMNGGLFLLYLSITPIILFVMASWRKIVNFNWKEYRDKQNHLKKVRDDRLRDETEKAEKNREKEKVESVYYAVIEKPDKIKKFLKSTEQLAGKTKFKKSNAYNLAFYSSKLILKGLEDKNADFSLQVFNNYIDNIFPQVGSCQYRTNIIGNSLALAIMYKLDEVSEKVFSIILGDDFNVLEIENKLVVYNLACYYSINKEKEKMLEAIRQAVKQGKEKAQFLADEDFKAYWKDKSFLLAVEKEK